MTGCDRPTDWMLEAPLEELRGIGESEDARHLRVCAACAAHAERIVARTEGLDRALDGRAGAPDVEAILARASLAPVAGGEASRAGRRIESRRRWARAGMAAAAAVAGFLAVTGIDPRMPGPLYTPPSRGGSPTVASAPDHDVAVIATDNPDITVVWLF